MIGSMGRISEGSLEVREQTMPPRIADAARAELDRRARLEEP